MSKIVILSDSWRISESNRWPLACHASALASWANPPNQIDRQVESIWIAIEQDSSLLRCYSHFVFVTSCIWSWKKIYGWTAFILVASSLCLNSSQLDSVPCPNPPGMTSVTPPDLLTPIFGSCWSCDLHAPERRCSSRTFRYGYLVTT